MTEEDKALVERLREEADEWDEPKSHDEFDMRGMLHSAADRIKALSAENELLEYLNDLIAVPAGIIEDRGRMEERAAIVAMIWGDVRSDYISEYHADILRDLIDRIEGGGHLK